MLSLFIHAFLAGWSIPFALKCDHLDKITYEWRNKRILAPTLEM